MKLLVVSPVRDEEAYIETTLKCMCAQTVPPDKWIVVNDGSSDGTAEIVASYARSHPFIELVNVENRGFRRPGGGVVEAFYAGLSRVDVREYDVIAKLDGDLFFEPDTIAKILAVFLEEPRAGVVGGVRYERTYEGGAVRRIDVAKEHVGGPYKFYRRACFEEIGGLVRRSGWDGVDVIRANMMGWTTGERPHIAFHHLRPTGTANGEGLRKAGRKYGEVAYHMGSHVWFFLFRAVLRTAETRSLGLGFSMTAGFIGAFVRGEERESRAFRKYFRKTQRENVSRWIGLLFSRLSAGISRGGFRAGNTKQRRGARGMGR